MSTDDPTRGDALAGVAATGVALLSGALQASKTLRGV
jgi:hypothetical protein